MDKNSRIYVAGHSGMVGSAIWKKLKNDNYNNIFYDSVCDLRDQSRVHELFKTDKPDYVFLAAAKVGGIYANLTRPAEFIYDNIMIASNVIHTSYKNNVKRLLNLGSSCIYPKFSDQPITENQLLNGVLEKTNEPYAIAKIAAIKMIQYYKKQYGCDYISLMPTNLYGNNDNYNLETSHVIPALLRKFILAKALKESNDEFIKNDITKNPIGYNLNNDVDMNTIIKQLESIGITKDYVEIWGSGEAYREFMHVDDLADACVYFMNIKDSSKIGNFINIGTGIDMKIIDIVYLIKNIVGFNGNVKFNKDKHQGTPKKLLDVSKAKDLGWTAKINITNGLNKVYKNYINGSKINE